MAKESKKNGDSKPKFDKWFIVAYIIYSLLAIGIFVFVPSVLMAVFYKTICTLLVSDRSYYSCKHKCPKYGYYGLVISLTLIIVFGILYYCVVFVKVNKYIRPREFNERQKAEEGLLEKEAIED